MNRNNKIRVVELFAGVGGFRVGLEKCSSRFETIWANQWEPSKKTQHAYDCYVSHFGKSENHINEDIAIAKHKVPPHDFLVGGFPCQDYSVAQSGAKGIEGKKGVLWWEIRDIVEKHRPSYILLENVDRLIKSPSSQRGRDFGIILRCLNDLGYAVEWRVINAAEYGFAQRRRRIFIFAYKNTTSLYKKLETTFAEVGADTLKQWIKIDGFYSTPFPVVNYENNKKQTLTTMTTKEYPTLQEVSDQFEATLYNSGVMIDGIVYSEEVLPVHYEPVTLRQIRHTEAVEDCYFLNGSTEKWTYLKGAKKIPRIRPNGEPYTFSEGGMCFPDDLDKPARTMLTSESSVNRSSHVIADAVTGRLRLLTPIECERLNGFDDNWTNTGMPHKFRYFTMGNALVVPVISRIGDRVLEINCYR
ncbi:MAG: DNA (cytosine-5-)-methyltransferase [Eubacteriales bacterium]